MEPTAENHPETPVVVIRTRPMFALCNVNFLLTKPLPNLFANGLGKDKSSMRFVNAAGGVSQRDKVSRSKDRRSGIWVLSDGFEGKNETP